MDLARRNGRIPLEKYDHDSALGIAAYDGVMADRIPTDPRQDADVMRQDATVGVVEAAQRLGITTDAVRARRRRGTLYGEKVAGEWQVHSSASDVTRQDATGSQQDATTDRQEGQQDPDRTPTVDLSPLADLIERQARELADLREAASVWQLRARQAEDKLLELAAGPDVTDTQLDPAPDTTGSPLSHETGPARRISWWRRLRGF
jgi:hypothetical protein